MHVRHVPSAFDIYLIAEQTKKQCRNLNQLLLQYYTLALNIMEIFFFHAIHNFEYNNYYYLNTIALS